MIGQLDLLGEHAIAPRLKKRKQSETPPNQITSSDKAGYIKQEERAAKRIAENNSNSKARQSKSKLVQL